MTTKRLFKHPQPVQRIGMAKDIVKPGKRSSFNPTSKRSPSNSIRSLIPGMTTVGIHMLPCKLGLKARLNPMDKSTGSML